MTCFKISVEEGEIFITDLTFIFIFDFFTLNRDYIQPKVGIVLFFELQIFFLFIVGLNVGSTITLLSSFYAIDVLS